MKKNESTLNEFLRYEFKRLYDDFLIFPCKTDWQNRSAEEWLRIISIDGYDQYKHWDWEYISNQRRGLKKLSKIAKEIRIEHGYMLVSMFMNISVVRDKIITEVKDGKEMDDFQTNPYDFDYAILPNAITKTIEKTKAMNYPSSWNQWKNKRVICCVSTQDAGKAPACPTCEGKGFLRCEQCGGSGREQYVDGYYASGEERIKTGQCSHCFGTGKLQCDDCMGTGKLQLLSNQYQIVKSFEDTKEVSGYVCYSNTIEDYCSAIDYSPEIITQEDGIEAEALKDVLAAQRRWLSFEDKELESGMVKLYKNQKELLVDRDGNLSNEISEVCKDLYRKNKKDAMEVFKNQDQKGKLACSVEKHLVVPMARIFYSYRDCKYEIALYEFDSKIRCKLNTSSLPELGFIKSLIV